MAAINAYLTGKRAHNSGGWGEWTTVSGADYIGQLNDGTAFVVYSAQIDGTATSVSVSTNFAAYTINGYGADWNTTMMQCYLCTSDPTGNSSRPYSYVGYSSSTENLYQYGSYKTFIFNNVSVSGTVYFFFAANIYPNKDNGVTYRDWIYSYATGNGHTQQPYVSASGTGGSSGGSEDIQRPPQIDSGETGGEPVNIKIYRDENIESVSFSEGVVINLSVEDDHGIYDEIQFLSSHNIYLTANPKDGFVLSEWICPIDAPYTFSTDNPVNAKFPDDTTILAKSIRDPNLSQYVFIYENGEFKQYRAYVFTNGEWHKVAPCIYSNDKWGSTK